jgi:hypothetical protein
MNKSLIYKINGHNFLLKNIISIDIHKNKLLINYKAYKPTKWLCGSIFNPCNKYVLTKITIQHYFINVED